MNTKKPKPKKVTFYRLEWFDEKDRSIRFHHYFDETEVRKIIDERGPTGVVFTSHHETDMTPEGIASLLDRWAQH